MHVPEDLKSTLAHHGQLHLLTGWDTLPDLQKSLLLDQLANLDLDRHESLMKYRAAKFSDSDDGERLADRAKPPQQLLRLAEARENRERQARSWRAGEELLRQGTVGAILVAGGQGTRLGFDAPKGMFPIGPVSERTLFQVLSRQLLARAKRAGKPIPYFIMTSDATHDATVDFFTDRDFFGLGKEHVYFFKQGVLPAVDDSSSRILLAEPGVISTSPDGHGGMLIALKNSGLLDEMRGRGIEHLYYHQVDNPTATVCDPLFLGEHLESQSDMSTKVVAKTSPEEKMGVVVDIDGQTMIIEYSDLTPEESRKIDPSGNYIFWAGNTAMHVFRRSFLDQLTQSTTELPYHIAHKAVPHVNEAGENVMPSGNKPNAHKFEQFIFDALPFARVALVVEADRSREFNPVKNATGSDSPETSRRALNSLARNLLASAGAEVHTDAIVEICPLYALDESDLTGKISPGTRFDEHTVLE